MNVDDGLNSFVQCDLSRIGFVDIELYRSSNRITLGYKVFLTRRNKNQRAAMENTLGLYKFDNWRKEQ